MSVYPLARTIDQLLTIISYLSLVIYVSLDTVGCRQNFAIPYYIVDSRQKLCTTFAWNPLHNKVLQNLACTLQYLKIHR